MDPEDATFNKAEPSSTCEGHFVSLTSNKVVMTNKERVEHSFVLASDVQFTSDAAVCKAEDLKAGRKIRVTTRHDDRTVATVIESLDEDAEIAQ